MDKIFSAALVHTICPICGNKMNEQIIMNTILTTKNAQEIENAHGKCIGYDDNACEKCSEYKDKGVFFIVINPNLGTSYNPYRTGIIACIDNKNEELIADIQSFINKTKNNVKFVFIDEEAAINLNIIKS